MDIHIRRNYLFVCSSCFLAAREKVSLFARYGFGRDISTEQMIEQRYIACF